MPSINPVAMETIAWIGFSQGLFAALLLLTKKQATVSDKLLTAWLSLLALEFLSCALDYRTYGLPLLSSTFLLFNPAFYLYTKTLVDHHFKLDSLQLVHLLPFLVFESLTYAYQTPYSLHAFFEQDKGLIFRVCFGLASLLSWIGYNLATGRQLVRHRRVLLNELSTIEHGERVSWLLFVVLFYNVYCLAGMAVAVSVIVLEVDVPVMPVFSYSFLLLLVYILGFYGLRQNRVAVEVDTKSVEATKYSHSTLTKTKRRMIVAKLTTYMNEQHPYLNPELNMGLLSQALAIPKHQLTETLSTELGTTFYRYVNALRVEAVKQLLRDKPDYSIEAIGFECGFNSKSTFFKVFKQLTGYTPAGWLSRP